MSRIPDHVAVEVLFRSRGECELPECDGGALSLAYAFHHRQPRGMGGTRGRDLDVAPNLMYLHDRCHERVHANPDWSRERGYIVSKFLPTPTEFIISQACTLPECNRPTMDGQLACSIHWAKVRLFTRQRFSEAQAEGPSSYDLALAQVHKEMRE